MSANNTTLRNGAECVGFSEIDKHAESIYRYHWPEHRNYGDASRIVPDELPDFDFLIAGFPCQAFSIAGKRQGFNDTRGTLFFEIARVLSHKRPSHFLLENVRGLVSHDDGKTIAAILGILADLDYFVELVVLNSKDYGVPQNRERCFFIGHLASECSREILSVGNDGHSPFEESGGIRRSVQSSRSRYGERRSLPNKPLPQDGSDGHAYQGIGTLRTHKDGEGFRRMSDNTAPTLNARARQDGSQQAVILIRDQYDKQETRPTLKWVGEPRTRLDGQIRIRRLTPVEAERLQGLPDSFTQFGRYGDEIKEVSDTQRYKCLGNSFTVNVIEAIVSAMIKKGCKRPSAISRRL